MNLVYEGTNRMANYDMHFYFFENMFLKKKRKIIKYIFDFVTVPCLRAMTEEKSWNPVNRMMYV